MSLTRTSLLPVCLAFVTLTTIPPLWPSESVAQTAAPAECDLQSRFQQTTLFRQVQQGYEAQVKPIFEKKCRDCHSDRVQYPFYYGLPGISQQIDTDIVEGRKKLDFSCGFPFLAAGNFSPLRTRDLLEGMRRAIAGNTMPPTTYLLAHPLSGLSSAEKKSILVSRRFVGHSTA